jgi:hypothetical protein
MKPSEIRVNGLNFISIFHQAGTDIDMDSEDSAYEVDAGVDGDDDTPMLKGQVTKINNIEKVIDDDIIIMIYMIFQ